jgi:hypothetical protein
VKGVLENLFTTEVNTKIFDTTTFWAKLIGYWSFRLFVGNLGIGSKKLKDLFAQKNIFNLFPDVQSSRTVRYIRHERIQ